jgi:hypothetical protein
MTCGPQKCVSAQQIAQFRVVEQHRRDDAGVVHDGIETPVARHDRGNNLDAAVAHVDDICVNLGAGESGRTARSAGHAAPLADDGAAVGKQQTSEPGPRAAVISTTRPATTAASTVGNRGRPRGRRQSSPTTASVMRAH